MVSKQEKREENLWLLIGLPSKCQLRSLPKKAEALLKMLWIINKIHRFVFENLQWQIVSAPRTSKSQFSTNTHG